jgi:hypothetical protein
LNKQWGFFCLMILGASNRRFSIFFDTFEAMQHPVKKN